MHLKTFLQSLACSAALSLAVTATAQTAMPLKQHALKKWHIGAAQLSGITHLGGNRYALVSDKEAADGFFVFRIDQNNTTGDVTNVYMEGFYGNARPKVDAHGISIRDCEGVAFFPAANTLFISGEGDQRILEYDLKGQPTGRELNVPRIFSSQNIVFNYGFEALCYDKNNHLFWTTSESTLPADGYAASAAHPGVNNVLRLQAFGDDLQPVAEYAYKMDAGRKEKFGKTYVFGVPEVTSLPDGRLLVLEREANVTKLGLKSNVRCKLFITDPLHSPQIDSSTKMQTLNQNDFVIKKLLAEWNTKVGAFGVRFANYEGMCLGRTLADGRQTLLLVSDSQGGYRKGPYSLKDFIKVVVIGN